MVFSWNGKDAYGRTLEAKAPANVTVKYVYDTYYPVAFYFTDTGSPKPPGWAIPVPGFNVYVTLRATETSTSTSFSQRVGVWDARGAGFGGWTLTEHHTYDHSARTIQNGDGGRSNLEAHPPVMRLIAGNGQQQFGGDNGPAKQASLNDPHSVAVGPDGAIYIGEIGRVRRVDPNSGIITTFAGNGNGSFAGDNVPATSAGFTPWDLAFGADGTLYIADQTNRRLLAISSGIAHVIGGNGTSGAAVNGGTANLSALSPHGVAVGADGSLYVADSDANHVYRIMRDGRIYWVAGNGSYVDPFQNSQTSSTDATGVPLSRPAYLAVDSGGGVYFTTEGNAVLYVNRDGGLDMVAAPTHAGDLYSVTTAEAGGITLSGGDFYLAQPSTNSIQLLPAASTVANRNRTPGYSGDDGPALDAQLNHPLAIAFRFGRLLIADNGNSRVRVIDGLMPGTLADSLNFPSADGSEFYVFDFNGRHQRTVDAMTGVTTLTFQYDTAGRLASMTDRDGNITRINRDGSGNATSIVAPGGQTTTLAIGGDGYLSSITNPAAERYSFTYSNGLMQSMTDPRTGVHTFTYDSEGRLQTDRDPAGGTSTFVRSGLVDDYTVTRTTAEGKTSSFHVQERDGGARTVTTTASDGTATTQTVDRGGTTVVQQPDGTSSRMTPLGDARFGLFAPQANGRFTTPFGHQINTSTLHVVSLSNPSDPFSSPSSETSTLTINGRTYSSTFTAATQSVQQTTPAGRQLTLTLDTKGRASQSQVPGITPFGFTYSTSGLLSNIQQGTRATSFGYDPQRRLTSITDPLSRTVQFQYDAADRVTKQILPDAREINFAYDHNGNLTSITPPGRPQHLFAYTPVDLTQSYTPPTVVNGGATSYSYNRDRQLTLIARPDSRNVSLAYDTAGRLGTLTIARGAYTFGYNAATGNLATIQAPDGGSLSYDYDGSLLTQMSWNGTVQGNISWNYDNDLAVTQETVCDPFGKCQPVFFDYDQDKLLADAFVDLGFGNNFTLTLTRDPGNGLVTGTTAGAITDAWTYNGFGEPASYQAQAGTTPVFAQSYTRDAGGRITQKSETISGVSSTFTYGYDTAGRLTSVTKDGNPVSNYTYDSNSNRLTKNAEVGTYDAQDRLLTYNGATYTYTANGELQTKVDATRTTSYSYDELGNLLSVTKPDGTLIEYVIDAQNRRVGKKINGTLSRQYLYSDALRIAAELDGSGNIVSRFIYATRSNVPDLMQNGGAIYRIVSDHLGSPRLIVNAFNGDIAEQIEYDEFGNVTNDTNPGFQPFGFAGGLYDRDTKLVRFGTRDYDAQVGRWTATDPVRFEGGDLALYTYANQDPINWLDPTGLREGSAANLAKRRAIDETARGFDGSTAWALNKRKGAFGPGVWKCNLFVYDVTHQAGAEARYDDRAPRAGEWADPNTHIDNWRVLGPGEAVKAGDVTAYKLPGGGAAFSGHSGIMITGPDGSVTNISAHADGVYTKPGQFETQPGVVYRRYTGD
ncbi:MAG: hypothetical protein M3041_03365 [Acidobacteriota bacterium]|nr:hypothetical protein [Acidobacteriota bacterium]